MVTAIDLIRNHNCHNFIILEKSNNFGGTWLDNKYPGCCCDGRSRDILESKAQVEPNVGCSVEHLIQLQLRTEHPMDARVPRSRRDAGEQGFSKLTSETEVD